MKTYKNNILVHFDEAKMAGVPGYKDWWDTQRKISERTTRFLRELIEKYNVSKSSIYLTGKMHNRTLNEYLDVPEGMCLSQEAIEHMAVIIVLLEPVINIHEEKLHLLDKKGGMQGAILQNDLRELETLRKDFREAFGNMAQELIYNANGLESVERLNEYYHYMFSNLKNKKIL